MQLSSSSICMFSHSVAQSCPIFVTPWTVTHQAPLSMEISRHEYRCGLPFSTPGDLSDSGSDPHLLHWQVDSLPLNYLGSPIKWQRRIQNQAVWCQSPTQPVNHNVQDIGQSLQTEIHTSKLLGRVCLKFSEEKMILHIKGIESSQVLLEHQVRRLQKARRDAEEKLGNKVNDPFPATYKLDISFRNNQAAFSMVINVEWYLYNIYIKIWANVATLEQFRVKIIKKSLFPKWMNLALVPFLTISVLKMYIHHSHSAIRISFNLLWIMSYWAILL